jgi:hypothetical protein
MLWVGMYRMSPEDGGGWDVCWSQVVGVVTVVEDRYVRVRDDDHAPVAGVNHAEMVELGWRSDHPRGWFPEVWPVVADGNGLSESPLRVLHDRWEETNLVHQAVVPCTWPPQDDRDHAIEIGRGLIECHGSRSAYVHLSDDGAVVDPDDDDAESNGSPIPAIPGLEIGKEEDGA